MKKLFKPFKPLLYSFLRSDAGKKFIINLLEQAAKQTTNTLDDQAVSFVKARLYPGSTTTLQ
jgi:hypothetical protein